MNSATWHQKVVENALFFSLIETARHFDQSSVADFDRF